MIVFSIELTVKLWMDRALTELWKKNLLRTFIDIKIKKIWALSLCEDFCEEISQPPYKQRFGFCDSSLFLAMMSQYDEIFRHFARAPKRKTNLRSHDFEISGQKTSKYKSYGNLSRMKKFLMTCGILAW